MQHFSLLFSFAPFMCCTLQSFFFFSFFVIILKMLLFCNHRCIFLPPFLGYKSSKSHFLAQVGKYESIFLTEQYYLVKFASVTY